MTYRKLSNAAAVFLVCMTLGACVKTDSQAHRENDSQCDKASGDAERFSCFLRLAEQGDAIAQATVAVLYVGGAGIAQDAAQAKEWMEKAAEGGNPDAQMTLANGTVVEALPPAEAVYWYEKAAEQGYSAAQQQLGTRYFQGGAGVPQDFIRAYAWMNVYVGQTGDSDVIFDRLKENMNKT